MRADDLINALRPAVQEPLCHAAALVALRKLLDPAGMRSMTSPLHELMRAGFILVAFGESGDFESLEGFEFLVNGRALDTLIVTPAGDVYPAQGRLDQVMSRAAELGAVPVLVPSHGMLGGQPNHPAPGDAQYFHSTLEEILPRRNGWSVEPSRSLRDLADEAVSHHAEHGPADGCIRRLIQGEPG